MMVTSWPERAALSSTKSYHNHEAQRTTLKGTNERPISHQHAIHFGKGTSDSEGGEQRAPNLGS